MNIVYLTTVDNGHQSFNLSRAVNTYTKHHARAIRYATTKNVPGDITIGNRKASEEEWKILEDSDVLHLDVDRLDMAFPFLGDDVRLDKLYHEKKLLVHLHYMRSPEWHKLPDVRIVKSSPDQITGRWLPLCLDPELEWLRPVQKIKAQDKYEIVHPHNSFLKHPEIMLEAVGNNGLFQTTQYWGHDWMQECYLKRSAHYIFDQINLDFYSYGLNSIEAGLHEQCVFNNPVKDYPEEPPFLVARDTGDMIQHLDKIEKEGFDAERARQMRAWALRVHGPEAVLKQLLPIYEDEAHPLK